MQSIHMFLITLLVSLSGMLHAHPGHGMPGHDHASGQAFIGVEHLLMLSALLVAVFVLRRAFGGSGADDEE